MMKFEPADNQLRPNDIAQVHGMTEWFLQELNGKTCQVKYLMLQGQHYYPVPTHHWIFGFDIIMPCWWCVFPSPVPFGADKNNKEILLCTEFPIPPRYLRKIGGNGLVVSNDLEVFAPGPINSEERVRTKEIKRVKEYVK